MNGGWCGGGWSVRGSGSLDEYGMVCNDVNESKKIDCANNGTQKEINRTGWV